jgi:hypothetical protein
MNLISSQELQRRRSLAGYVRVPSMPNDDSSEAGFLFTLPVFVILDPTLLGTTGIHEAIRMYEIDDRLNCLALFTDLDLAARFIQEEQLSHRRPWEVTTPTELMELLLHALRRGVSEVALDLSGRRGRFVSLQSLLNAVAEQDKDLQ